MIYPYIPYDAIYYEHKHYQEVTRSEITAADAYNTIIQRYPRRFSAAFFKLRNDHRGAAKYWKKISADKEFHEINSSGFYGSIMSSFVSLLSLMGLDRGLKALYRIERTLLKNYVKLLKDPSLGAKLKNKIRDTYIPMQKRHLGLLADIKSNI